MPLRPSYRLRLFASVPRLSTLPSPSPSPWPLRRALHASAVRQAEPTPTHYQTLDLPPSATPAEIKRQFYALSKKHHPDRNQHDPNASNRFVAISEAYHVLSVPAKRQQYDASLSAAQGSSWTRGSATTGAQEYPQGSYSSASFGARPASGLNKKRSTFRGPPPSFYKAGGYGATGAKRSQYAYQPESGPQTTQEQHTEGSHGGFGPGQQAHGSQVPHFDDKRHKETHDNVYAHIWARRQETRRAARVKQDYERGHVLINFLVLSGVLGIIGLTAKLFGDQQDAAPPSKSRDHV